MTTFSTHERVSAVVGIGATALAVPVGIGWFYARVLLDTTIRPIFPERVLAVDADTVTLSVGGLALQPGTWGLRWPAGLALIGPALLPALGEVAAVLAVGSGGTLTLAGAIPPGAGSGSILAKAACAEILATGEPGLVTAPGATAAMAAPLGSVP